MKVLSIDGATKRTGVAMITDGRLTNWQLLDFSKYVDFDIRFAKMIKTICEILKKSQPDCVFIEEAWVGKNPDVAKKLSRLIGALQGWCIVNDIVCNIIFPSEWRKVLGMPNGRNVKREEAKSISMDYVRRVYAIDVGDDIADAVCIATAGYQIMEQKL